MSEPPVIESTLAVQDQNTLEADFNQVVTAKILEFQQLSARRDTLIAEWERAYYAKVKEVQSESDNFDKLLAEARASAEAKLSAQLSSLESETVQMSREREAKERFGQIALEGIRADYAKKIAAASSHDKRLKGLSGIEKQDAVDSKTLAASLSDQISKLQATESTLTDRIKELAKDCAELNDQLGELDQAIKAKDRVISDLLAIQSDLQKAEFVLSHRFTELQHQVDPKSKKIDQLTIEAREKDKQLEIQHGDSQSAEKGLADLKESSRVGSAELDKEKLSLKRLTNRRKKMIDEFARIVELCSTDEGLLLSKVEGLVSNSKQDGGETKVERKAGLDELDRQIVRLESVQQALKKKYITEKEHQQLELNGRVRANSALLAEIEETREKIKVMNKETQKRKAVIDRYLRATNKNQ